MKILSKKNNKYILRFSYQEDFQKELGEFFKKEKIKGGWISGLGALIDPVIAYYDLKKKKYLKKKLKGFFEVLNLAGNIAQLEGETVTHIHITLGDKNYKALGGHFVSGKVGGTIELLVESGHLLKRKKDKSTRLNLLS